MTNILLLNSTVDHAFGFFRSFDKLDGYRVFWADSVNFAPAKTARCCQRVFPVPSVKSEKEYIHVLHKIIIENDINLLLPIGEYETKTVARNAEYLRTTGVIIPIAGSSDIELATDKLRLQEHCSAIGIEYAKTFLLDTTHSIDYHDLKFPVIVKQRSGTGQKGMRIIPDATAFNNFVSEKSWNRDNDSFIIQEYIPGYDHENMYSVGLLFNHGRLVALVPLKKIRAQKFTGGTCTASTAVENHELISIAERIGFSFPGWHGIMDIEIKQDPRTGKYVLIEINPRPWGCMYGAMTAGVDFPRLWIENAENKNVRGRITYQANMSSSFLARDILLVFELIIEIAFGRLKKQALSVLKTFKYPYFASRKKNSSYPKTSDFILYDIRPFITNILRQVYSK